MVVRDGDWKLWKYDHHTQVSTWHLFDGEKHVFCTETPVAQILDDNKALAAEREGKRHLDGVGELVARIPMSVAFDKINDPLIQGDQKALGRFLNDSDNARFRVRGGRV